MQEMQETQVQPLGQEDSLEEGMATLSSILVWRIPWTVEPGKLHFIGPHRVRCDWNNLACMHAQNNHLSESRMVHSTRGKENVYAATSLSEPESDFLNSCFVAKKQTTKAPRPL